MIVAMVYEVGHHMRPADLGGICWSDGGWKDRVYSWKHSRVTGLHPCSGWYERKVLYTRRVE